MSRTQTLCRFSHVRAGGHRAGCPVNSQARTPALHTRMQSGIGTGVLILLVSLMQLSTRANDSIFAPKPAAQGVINFNGKGFLVNGQRTFIASAGMEYARVPQELWADRLMRFKRAGFNCTEFYTFWNYHETQSGQFDFSGNQDLDAYLKLAKSLGLYSIARVGPYYCAEWDSGGYPVWLRFVPNLEVRNNNTPFKQYVTRFFGQLLPIVMTNQIHRGGSVILVQLENEHPSGWGTDGLGNAYFQYLQSAALAAGLEVPYFFSGLNHGSDPAGSNPWSSASRGSPWMTTEFWCDWYNVYGESASDAAGKDWATWKIIAYGGNGYNYYMAHGGTDFDYFNNDEDAASYDYGAAVGQTGDLRLEYYKFKRAAWFARSFQNILEASDNATSTYSGASTNSAVTVTARASAAGTILFLCNSGSSAQATRAVINSVAYPQTGTLTVNSSEIVPIVTGYTIIPGVTLKVAPTRILGTIQQGNTTTLVIYGQAGAAAELYFTVPAGTTISAGAPALSLSGTNLTLQTTFPSTSSGASNFSFQTGSRRVRVLAVSDSLADDTWFVDVGAQNYVICGPQYVGAAMVTNSYLRLSTEKPWQNPANNAVTAYGPNDAPMSLSAITTPASHPGAATLSAWQTMSGISQAAPGYDTSSWLSNSSGPLQMGADGDASCYAWYRTTVNVSSAGSSTISIGNYADHMIPFVDGTAVTLSGSSFTTSLSAGNHTIAIFTSHSGRNKFYPYVGAISQLYVKGLSGTARFYGTPVSGPTSLTSGWTVMMTNSAAVGKTPPAPGASGWSSYTFGADAFGGQAGYGWFQTTLPVISSAGAVLANFSSVDDNAWVYLNGTVLATNTGWNVPFTVDLTSAWIPSGPNVLTVLVQNTGGSGGLYTAATLTGYQSVSALTNWVQLGGPGNPNSTTGWQTLGSATFNGPQFFKTTFTAPPPGMAGTNPMWRATTTGLSRGSVWVNGHNLGRYPEKTPAPGVYIPECWLNAGANANTLVIYDEQGNRPTQVAVQPETGASRDVILFQTAQIVSANVPPAPTGLVATANGTAVTLSWNTAPGTTSYNVKRSAIAGNQTTIAFSDVTNYTDTGLIAGTTYYYAVSAVNADGESTNSVEVTVSFPKLTGSVIGTSGSYNNLGNTIAKVFDGDLATFFDAPSASGCWAGLDFGSGVSNIIVQINYCPRSTLESRMTGGIFQGANQADFSDAVTLFTVTAQPPSSTFTSASITNTSAFRYVRYLSPANGWCNVAELEFYGYRFSVPAPVPTGLTAIAVSTNQINLVWDTLANATSYKIKRSLTNGGPYALVAGAVTATNYSNTGLAAGTTYYYVISAVVGGNETADSGQALASTLSPTLGSLLHRYSFNETGGTTVADSVGGPVWNGILPNGGTFSAGQLTLSSNLSQYVLLPAGIMSPLSNFTIEVWAKLNTTANGNRLFDFGNSTSDYMFLTPQSGSSGKLRFGINTPGNAEQDINGSDPLSTGVTNSLAVTLDGTLSVMYLNGIAVGTNSYVTNFPSGMGITTNNWLGRSEFSTTTYLDGALEEFRIYNAGFSSAEIAATYALGPSQLLSTSSPSIGLAVTDTNLTISWPLACAGFVLQSRTNLVLGDWENVASPVPQVVNGQWQIPLPLPASAISTFYRLIK
jgi:beta-galactosidase